MQMKKIRIIAMLLVVVLLGAIMAVAGSVYDRDTLALSATAGTGTWTNDTQYAALLLKRIWIQDSLATNGVYTISRVSTDGYTDAVGTVTLGASTNGSTASFTAAYLKYGDTLTFATTVATGATAVIEFEVQKH